MYFSLPFQIETERLTLRDYRPDDAELLLEISRRNSPHWQEFESENILYNLADLAAAEKAAAVMAEEWRAGRSYFIGLFEKGSGSFAGQLYLGVESAERLEFEAGYVADQEHEGKGFITEALTALLNTLFTGSSAAKVWIHCSDRNPRSARVAERCGFQLVEHYPISRHNPAHGGELVYLRKRADAGPESHNGPDNLPKKPT
jgi:RimJ/RimL family protein N-acetyltransferase